ncbi:hypothetical protein GCM10009808_23290 [Microbacterium sediminicola]|uniref:Htaa protein n=1 Tax=Microbacterium sediminicola TaxID=415210 RepID=A0ABN2IGJ0_9MICO
MRRSLTRTWGALALGLAVTIGLVSPASPAYAAASVSVSVEGYPELTYVADPTYLTQLRVSGSGFQSIQNGFGGIYVMFGWVAGSGWAPSQGGSTGTTYRYVPDDETNPTGYVAFVSFPGSSTEYAANGGTLSSDGSWSTVLSIPGAQFTALDRDGNATQVDCLQVQCGIITVGAHGVVNANNETFTPITFQDLYGEDEEAVEAAPVATPEPAQTTIVVEEETVEATAAAEEDPLVPILLWSAGGIGILAIASMAFLVWAVLSSRRRSRRATDSTPPPAA